jgi:hypothetical protein
MNQEDAKKMLNKKISNDKKAPTLW